MNCPCFAHTCAQTENYSTSAPLPQVCTAQAAPCRPMPIRAPTAASAATLPTANRTAATQRQQPARVRYVRSTHVQAASQESLAAAPAAAAQAKYPDAWEQCVAHLQSMGFAEADAETYVLRAFGWGARARSYWRHDKVRTSSCVKGEGGEARREGGRTLRCCSYGR
jgi:hypothetical protein